MRLRLLLMALLLWGFTLPAAAQPAVPNDPFLNAPPPPPRVPAGGGSARPPAPQAVAPAQPTAPRAEPPLLRPSPALALAVNDAGIWATRLAPTIAEARSLALQACNRAAAPAAPCRLAQQHIAENTRGCMALWAAGDGRRGWGWAEQLGAARATAAQACQARGPTACTERVWSCIEPHLDPPYRGGGPDHS